MIRFTAKVRRGLILVYAQAVADSATRNMRRDKFTPEEREDFYQALGWIDQETSPTGTGATPVAQEEDLPEFVPSVDHNGERPRV